jgi:TfoX/Sxy family transcriptional regulator of competence genes
MPATTSNTEHQWRKAPADMIDLFLCTLQLFPQAEVRRMFGYPCAFVNGQMFTGLHQEHMILRLSEADRRELLALEGAHLFEPMPGRPMREYAVVPPAILSSPDKLESWLERSLRYASSLPPKAPSRKKR